MKISRIWAMPNKWTFTIKPIKELINRIVPTNNNWVDPFAGNNSPASLKNDINPLSNSESHMKAIPFLESLKGVYDGVLLDPPYSPRQVSEHYKAVGLKPSQWETSSGWTSKVKNLVATKIKIGGICVCFGWNSMGLGKGRGFEIIEILLVPHGGSHNDTIVTVEKKVKNMESDSQ